MASNSLFIGLMSGTSMDGVDAVLGHIDKANIRFQHHIHYPYPQTLVEQLQSLCLSGPDEIDRMGELDNSVADCFANATNRLLQSAGIAFHDVTAIGSHGQTIRHRPREAGCSAESRFTLQIGNPHWIAEHTQIPVVADFRRKDMLLGGHGAPLAPGFHNAWLPRTDGTRVVLNLGGIANITELPAASSQRQVTGFDTGPANALLDAWYRQHHASNTNAESFDRDGVWASQGEVIPSLLNALLNDPYFAQRPPKSTGKEYFNLNWVNNITCTSTYAPEDVQATLLALTVESVAHAIENCISVTEVVLCGGGALNTYLINQLQQRLPSLTLVSSHAYGLDPMQVEGMAFAWLAHQFWNRQPGNLPSVTGAAKSAILGALHLPN